MVSEKKVNCRFSVLDLLHISTVLLASPLIPRDDSNYRFNLVPDSEGKMHMVDLNPLETPIEPAFNPEVDVIFLLFTRQNPNVGQRIILNNLASVRNSNFNPSHPTRFTGTSLNKSVFFNFNLFFFFLQSSWLGWRCELNYQRCA